MPRRMRPMNVANGIAVAVVPDTDGLSFIAGLATGSRVDGELCADGFEGGVEVFTVWPNGRVSRNVDRLGNLVQTKRKSCHQHRTFGGEFPSAFGRQRPLKIRNRTTGDTLQADCDDVVFMI